MDFASRITRAPIPFDEAAGADSVAEFSDLRSELKETLAGASGCSPHLRGLMAREANWLRCAFEQSPESVASTLVSAEPPERQEDLGRFLRIAKGRLSLFVGLADLAGVWTLEQVTRTLTNFADYSVHLSMRAAVGAEIRRNKLPGIGSDQLPSAGGMVALAMGKMGAAELNYSSDIDLICLFDESRFDERDFHDARASFIRATRKMTALLSDMTGDGYVWRTDLRLRPDPSVTPVCMSMDAAERYYESVGRTWERAAHIKARASAGDVLAAERYLQRLTPFIWRRHLDFAAIEDAHDMRLRIRDHKGQYESKSLDGRDLKLGPGGIREIEFFTQTRQIIAGGRDPSLRLRGTTPALVALAEAGWIPHDLATELSDHYRVLREIEHRVQMVADARTHLLPSNSEGFDRIARMCGYRDTAYFKSEIADRLTAVREISNEFFAPVVPNQQGLVDTVEPEIVERWRHYPALRSSRAQQIFERLKPDLIARLNSAPRPDEAFAAFDGFLSGLPAGVQLLSMFEANPHLRALIVDIASISPALASYLSTNSQVLDAVIAGTFFEPWPGKTILLGELSALLQAAEDYEQQLDVARRWRKEWHFRIGVHHLRGIVDAAEAGCQFSELAETVLTAMLPVVANHMALRHGPPPGAGAIALGMGSLGAGWINSRSDLDLIMIYEPGESEVSEGPKPLPVVTYYTRLTKALLTALTAPTAEGRLYEVDMRLRPSGRQGPVATSLSAFDSYQKTEAWTWEHLALTRARVVAGSRDVGKRVESIRISTLEQPRAPDRILSDVRDMRLRLSEAKKSNGPLDVKPGPGGLQDIELAAQTAALIIGSTARRTVDQLNAGVLGEWLTQLEANKLTSTYRLARSVQSVGRLIVDGVLDAETLGQGGRDVLARETGVSEIEDLLVDLEARRTEAAEIIGDLMNRIPNSRVEPK